MHPGDGTTGRVGGGAEGLVPPERRLRGAGDALPRRDGPRRGRRREVLAEDLAVQVTLL